MKAYTIERAFGLALIMMLAASAGASTEPVEIKISQGTLVGRAESGVQRFLGIPFARPPVGERRFRSPESASPWTGKRDASDFMPRCAQRQFTKPGSRHAGSEDCLYLNITRPDLATTDLPVLVWIHGGGRRVGDGRRDVGAFVRATDSLVVSIQYRLDQLAFLAHPALSAEDPSRLASGNYGFEDAIEALRWIQNEIHRFGGDPGNVTIAGNSGGGTMVCGLLASPRAAGLFHRGIIQSAGSCWFPTDPIESAEARGILIASEMRCDETSTITDCLRSQPIDSLLDARAAAFNPFDSGTVEWYAAQPMLGARNGHIVDGFVFPRSLPDAFAAGTFHRVPLMISITEHEGRAIYGELLYSMGAEKLKRADYERALSGLLGSPDFGRRAAEMFPAGDAPAERFADIATDVHYTCPHVEMAAATSRFAPTWLYQFRVRGPRESTRIELGSYHGVDTELLFGPILDEYNEEQAIATKRLRDYVANFMRSGDPNHEGALHWPRYTAASDAEYLEFMAEPQVSKGLREKACRIHRTLNWPPRIIR